MLVANVAIEEHFYGSDVQLILRIHENPDEGKLEHFFQFIGGLGISVKGTMNDVHPKALQNVLERVESRPEEMVVSKLMLRSMQQAKYDPESIGHFGLA